MSYVFMLKDHFYFYLLCISDFFFLSGGSRTWQNIGIM